MAFLKTAFSQGRIRFYSFFRKPISQGLASDSRKQADFDKKLVLSLSKSRIPSWRQIRYAGKVLSPRELMAIRISLFILAATVTAWFGFFYFSHRQIVAIAGGTHKEAMLGMPQYINPLYENLSDVDSDLGSLIFSALYRRGPNSELKPDLAEKTDVSADARVYTIKITDQALWHDDKPLTADDVIFTFSAIKDAQYKSTLRGSFEGVAIEKTGDFEFKFVLNEPYAAFLDLLTFGILPAHLWSQIPADSAPLAELNLKPVGSGPYRFVSLTKDKNGSIKEYLLKPNEQYYAKHPLVDLQFSFYQTIEEAVSRLNDQTVSAISYLPFVEAEKILTPNSFTFEKLNLPQISLVFFNQKRNPALADKALRQALSFALDRNEIVVSILSGNAYLAEGPIPSGSFAYFPGLKKYDYQSDESARLLDQLDWKIKNISAAEIAAASQDLADESKRAVAETVLYLGEGNWRQKNGQYLIIDLKTVDRGENLAVIEKIRDYWAAIGVKARIEAVPALNIQANVIRSRNFDAFFYGQILGADPDPYVFWHSSQTGENGYNIAGFANKEVDALLEDARLNADIGFRQEKYRQFQEIIKEEAPAIFMYSPIYNYVHSNKLKGFAVYNISLPRDRFSNVSDWYLKTGRRFTWEQ